MALRALAHLVPGPKVLDFVAPESLWLDIRWRAAEAGHPVMTPHVTWYTVDTMRRYLVAAIANCGRLRDGNWLAHVVNQPTGY